MIITTTILSETYTIFPTRGISFQILIVHRDHTQFSLRLLINCQWIQWSIHLKFSHISTILALRSLPTNKSFWSIRVRKRLYLLSSQFTMKRSKRHLLVSISLTLLCWLSNQLTLIIFRLKGDISNSWSRRDMTTRATSVHRVSPTTTFAPFFQGRFSKLCLNSISGSCLRWWVSDSHGIHSKFVLSP